MPQQTYHMPHPTTSALVHDFLQDVNHGTLNPKEKNPREHKRTQIGIFFKSSDIISSYIVYVFHSNLYRKVKLQLTSNHYI